MIVIFGAGNIGRGFLAPLFSAGGWSVTFVDVDARLVADCNERGCYVVSEVMNDDEVNRVVSPVRAIDAADQEAVVAALRSCTLVATAVGVAALPHLGPPLAAGLMDRGQRPLDVLVCENGLRATDDLRAAISEHVPDRVALSRLGCVRTSIGRMVPAPRPDADFWSIRVEPYARLPLDAAGFCGSPPQGVPGLEVVDDFDLVARQKLLLHNMTHAHLAYSGAVRGYQTIVECMDDDHLVREVCQAAAEILGALVTKHGPLAWSSSGDLMTSLLRRYRNRALGDTVGRVARNPLRKLSGDDRLVGAARLCCAHGVAPRSLARGILRACQYHPAPDDPDGDRWNYLRQRGWRGLLAEVAELRDDEPLAKLLHELAVEEQVGVCSDPVVS
ncbi:MAG: mannitol dehydrogenase family protein [Planctomycetota bacterium]|jgi:mannitol-1-phosphate 5-dehydrogenase